ncbi:butyrophilin subfamily 1 member A1-like [Paramisgurnus dabryanus]|uniref:butyrophilin subfamily 1 member A1-like n=1 Tax=Paramisgurnus dabryanus TaxID=90735 RepID=UPI0031F3680C
MKFICVTLLIIREITGLRAAVGSPPFITVDGFDVSGGLHLQCESKGWYPEPELVWLDSKGVTLTSETTHKQRHTDGFRVKHMITVYNRHSKYYCRVTMGRQMLETEIILSSKMFNSWRILMALILVTVVLSVIAGIWIIVSVCKHRELQRKGKRLKSKEMELNNDHDMLLLKEKKIVKSLKSLFRKFAVNVTLDPDSAHRHLIVFDDGKQMRYEEQSGTVKDGDQKSNNKFDERPCVLGKEGFTSGCFYYEVKVKGLNRWFVGVARESVNRKGRLNLNPENGFWTVGLKNKRYQACGGPSVPLSLSVEPQRVGVFVDYEEGQISFYDVSSMLHIYSFTDQSFNEKLYPVFYLFPLLFKNSTASLIICSNLS